MIDPITLSAIVKGGTALGKYAYNRYFNKQPGFDNTDYGNRLKQLSTEGLYNSRVRSNMIGNVAQQTGNVAANTKADITGRLINSGMEGSIAGQASLNQVDNTRMGQIATATQDIETKNELSKEQYATEYAQAKQAYKDRITTIKQGNNQDLVGGLLDAAGTYVGGKINQAQMKGFGQVDMSNPTSVQGWVANQTDPAAAVDLIKGVAQANYYNQGRETSAEAKQAAIEKVVADFKASGSTNPQELRNKLLSMGLNEDQIKGYIGLVDQWLENNIRKNPNEF